VGNLFVILAFYDAAKLFPTSIVAEWLSLFRVTVMGREAVMQQGTRVTRSSTTVIRLFISSCGHEIESSSAILPNVSTTSSATLQHYTLDLFNTNV
jgi:hypothetical protein